jgi:hypothetical protein
MTYVPVYSELGGYRMLDNIAVPVDAATLFEYQTLQREINALLAKRNEPLIDVDGRIGGNTMSALLTLSSDPGSITSTSVIADHSYGLVEALREQMTQEWATFVPDPVPSSPPSVASGSGVVNPSDDEMRSAEPMSMTTKVALALGLGVIAAYVLKKRKRRSKR